MKRIIETQRLYLRELTTKDAIHFYKMNADSEVLKYTGDHSFKNIQEAELFLSNYKQYKLYNMGRWAVCLKTDHSFLGWCGLKYHSEEHYVDIGYRFYKSNWNKGFATESAKAAIKYGFEILNLKTIYAHAHINNIASHKVLEKCKLEYISQENYDGMPAKLFKIDHPDMVIKSINHKQTYPIRHEVLRQGKPIESCEFNGDELESTIHFGLILNSNILGVLSFFKNNNSQFKEKHQYQLRGMAISNQIQGRGFGLELLKKAEATLKTETKTELIWCNAREKAIPFYQKNNYNSIGEHFEISEIGTHVVMYKKL